ncbi:hypothetical protein Tco_1417372 [Tanacetum coccineum]
MTFPDRLHGRQHEKCNLKSDGKVNSRATTSSRDFFSRRMERTPLKQPLTKSRNRHVSSYNLVEEDDDEVEEPMVWKSPVEKLSDSIVDSKLMFLDQQFLNFYSWVIGSGPKCQDTILGGADAQTRFETASKQSNDPPLLRGYTLGSGEDSMKLLELMELCTKLSDLVSKKKREML